MFHHRVARFEVAGDLGLPLAHPLYILLAKLFCVVPLGDIEYRVNLFSAVCAAAALGFAADLLLSVTKRRVSAICGVSLLAVSHTFWTHAVIAEVYDLYALGLLAELALLRRFFERKSARWLIAAAFVNGLNLSNHLLAILHWPIYAAILIFALRRRTIGYGRIAASVLAMLIGASPYLVLIGMRIGGGDGFFSVFAEALLGPPDRARVVTAHSFPFLGQIKRSCLYFAMNFPTPIALLAIPGFWWARRDARLRWMAWSAGGIFAVSFVFAFRYLVADQFVFFTGCYVIVAVFAAVGVDGIVERIRVAPAVLVAFALAPAAVYEIAPSILRARGVSIGLSRGIPYRDSYEYFLRPRKNGYDGAERFAREALAAAAPDGMIYADTTIANLLVHARDDGRIEPGVTLCGPADVAIDPPTVETTPRAVADFAARGMAFVASDAANYVPIWIKQSYDLVPDGVIYRLVGSGRTTRAVDRP